MTTDKTDAQAIIDAVGALSVPVTLEVKRGDANGAGVVLIPAGMKPFNVKALLDEFLSAPERRIGTATLTVLASFIAHTKRFADADSVVFADPSPKSPSLTAVLDYHRAGSAGAPRFGKHRARYMFPLSDPWVAWTNAHDQPMDQAAFAAFIEDRIADIADPASASASAAAVASQLGVSFATPARLMELSRGLSLRAETRVGAAVNLSSGEGQLNFAEEHTDTGGGPLKIPGAFVVLVPVFRGDAAYQIAVRLRYRLQGGKVTWRCVLYRSERVFEDAFETACTNVEAATTLPVLRGTPEV